MVAYVRQHAMVDNDTLGSKRLVSLFQKGTLQQRPKAPAWDLPLVLDTQRLPPFEPLARPQLKWLFAKTDPAKLRALSVN